MRDIDNKEGRGSMKKNRISETVRNASPTGDKSKKSFKFKFWQRDKNHMSKKSDSKKQEEENAKNSKLKSEIRESKLVLAQTYRE